MAFLFLKSGGPLQQLRTLFQSLGVGDIEARDIPAPASSVGIDNFNVSDGAGGFKASSSLSETNTNQDLQADYRNINLWSELGGTIAIGALGGASNVPDTILLRAGADIRAFVGTEIFVLDAVTSGSLAPSRLLAWDGAQNVYLDPQNALYNNLFTSVDLVLTAADVELQHLTVEVDTATSGAVVTVTLPSPNLTRVGTRVTVKDAVGNAGTSPPTERVAVVVTGGSLIDGLADGGFAVDWGSNTYQVLTTGLWGVVAEV